MPHSTSWWEVLKIYDIHQLYSELNKMFASVARSIINNRSFTHTFLLPRITPHVTAMVDETKRTSKNDETKLTPARIKSFKEKNRELTSDWPIIGDAVANLTKIWPLFGIWVQMQLQIQIFWNCWRKPIQNKKNHRTWVQTIFIVKMHTIWFQMYSCKQFKIYCTVKFKSIWRLYCVVSQFQRCNCTQRKVIKWFHP